MCGITGFLLSRVNQGNVLREMTKAVAHRGPDDEGYLFVNRSTGQWAEFSGPDSPEVIRIALPAIAQSDLWAKEHQPDLALGHRRFAIISPTPDGHQPFWDSAHRVCLSLNGEIYNYLEVRKELEAIGHEFRTGTDTEVLIEAYRAWGDRSFEKLNGMWAVAIYDFDRRELVLCRDRTGERPLYWVRRPDGIYFASEIKALLTLVAERETPNDVALNFLHQGVADLDKQTFFRGIESVPIATVVRIGMDGVPTERRYWRAPDDRPERTPTAVASVADLCAELRDLLRDAVRLRLRADVPVNVALSGGMDSSSVVAMAATLRGDGVDTYTVRFAEKQWNEWPFAAAVAERYRVNNLVVDPPSDWMWAYFDRFVQSMEEPFHAPDLLPDHVVRRMLAARGIKVSLSGIGGDEIFAGYEHYRQFRILDLKRSGHRLSALKEIISSTHSTPAKSVMRLVRSRLSAQGEKSQAAARGDFRRRAFTSAGSPSLRALPQSCSDRLWADIDWSLLPYWLRAGDKSSMAIPIEVRYPFLDHRLIEFAMRLPLDLLIRDGWMKWLLRKAMEDMLPRDVVWRRQKMGFPFPIVEWLEGAVTELRIVFGEMDNPYLPREFWTEHLAELIRFDPWLVWRALSFEMWHRHFIRGLPVLPASLNDRVELAVGTRAVYA